MEGLHTRKGTFAHPRRGISGHRPRAAGVAYAVLSLAFAILIGALAVTSRESPPPTIAEFAPQAVERIRDASGDSAASRGAGSGAMSPLDEQAAANEAARQITDVARVRQCVGDPPRQIEDPQSPPCVPYWSGDNGGATARGVTRDEIRVVDPFGFESAAFEAFFNKRFEFYGRRIRLLARSVPQGNPPVERAAARAAYEQDQAFASTSVGFDQAYLDELARLGIVGVSFFPLFPETYLAAHRPFVWTYPMANDRLFSMTGAWFCARFAGHDAVHAGDPLLQATRRKPGVILTMADWEGTSVEPMNAQLALCRERADAIVSSARHWLDSSYVSFMQNAMLQMKTSGVTTVACQCAVAPAGVAMRAATNQGYFPEWLLTSYLDNESPFYVRFYQPPEQTNNLMLLLAHPMQRPYPEHPSNWAVQEATNRPYPGDSAVQYAQDLAYWPLLLIASGIQMAGPNLTPETFERGLHRARFPNSPHRIMAGAVGFTDGDHSMTEDAAEIWWSNTVRGPYGDPGTFCYVDHGARRRIGTFPADDPFFKGSCDNGTT